MSFIRILKRDEPQLIKDQNGSQYYSSQHEPIHLPTGQCSNFWVTQPKGAFKDHCQVIMEICQEIMKRDKK